MTAPTPLALRIRRDGPESLPAQIAGQVRQQVGDRTLPPDQRLPSTRALADELGVARAVVEAAYDQLLAEGWVVTRRGAGTFVHDVGLGRTVARSGRTPSRAARLPSESLVTFDTGTPYVDPRLAAGWRRAWREMAVATMPRGYPDPAGVPELRELVASYVGRHRGVACTSEEVMITSGTTHGLALVLGLLGAGSLAVEDPGYRAAVEVAGATGFGVIDVPVDAEGICVEALSSGEDTRAVYVTPAHQHPTGVTLSASRRVSLVDTARRLGALILEDDYDSEFRYDVAPLPALTSMSRDVIYLGTAAKAVHPALRIGWLIGPPDLVADAADRRARRHDHPSWPVQRAFLAMLRDGHVDRLVRSARRVYAERSDLVSRRLAPYTQVSGAGAGMYVTLPMPASTAAAVVSAARQQGLDVPSLRTFCRTHVRHGLVLGFGGVTDHELSRCLDVVEAALQRQHQGRGRGSGRA